ncbi:MAG: porin family protein [Prolixibacteraceae bacterium]|nr:porin family protein [Prolixibacteraceae bacterium]MBN2649953.1 porin family protein [Prolixibacteraceae bacterium]
MPVKQYILVIALIFASITVKSQQQTADFGFYGGVSYPFSDYTNTEFAPSVKPTLGAFYRYNFNSRISFRINALYGNVSASGYVDNSSVLLEFEKSVLDISASVEINYLDFILGVEKMNFSPYVLYGVGLSFFDDDLGNLRGVFNIPIGVGAKYSLSKRWGVGVELSTRKLFKDNLDNLDDPYREENLPKVNDWLHNNDWINYMGLTLTYKVFRGSRPCATYE